MSEKGSHSHSGDLSAKSISPLWATIFLVLLSIFLGAIVMTVGESYIGENAGFALGVPEVGAGCELVSFSFTKIQGVEHVCVKEQTLDVSLDSGPLTVIDDFHARIHGSEGVSNVQNLLNDRLNKNYGVRLKIPYSYLGTPLKVTVTPVKFSGGTAVYCTEQSLTTEQLPKCE